MFGWRAVNDRLACLSFRCKFDRIIINMLYCITGRCCLGNLGRLHIGFTGNSWMTNVEVIGELIFILSWQQFIESNHIPSLFFYSWLYALIVIVVFGLTLQTPRPRTAGSAVIENVSQ